MESESTVYQSNAYFGVFFPHELAETVLDFVREDQKWKGLAGSKREVKVNKTVLSWSINSDVKEGAHMAFVFADDLTFEGPERTDPMFNTLDLEPTTMIGREKNYPVAVTLITDLHTFLVQEFKKKRLSTANLHCGWRIISCVWIDGSESSEETSSSEKDTGASAVTGKTSPETSKSGKKSPKGVSGQTNPLTGGSTMSTSSETKKRVVGKAKKS